MPKSNHNQESKASPINIAVVSKTKRHKVTRSEDVDVESSRVQEEQEVGEEENTSTKSNNNNNKIVEDTTTLEQQETNNTVTVRGGEGQNEAPNLVPSCEKEAEYALDDNESICTVHISELDDELLLPKPINEALECERSLRLLLRCA